MEVSEMLEQVDIVDLISNYVELEQKNGEYWGKSPFKDEKTPSFSVRRETGKFYCFATGIGGNAVTFLKEYFHISAYEAVEKLKEYLGIKDDTGSYKPRQVLAASSICKKYRSTYLSVKPAATSLLDNNCMEKYEDKPEKYDIWRKEGITDEAMHFFGVRYDGFSNCLVYPVRNLKGEIVNIGGRTLNPNFKELGLRKYTYFNKWGGQMNIIYGLYENMNSIVSKKEIVLFEGMKSVLVARGYGINNTGAILTSHLNPGQMRLLVELCVKYGLRVLFALDKEVDVRKDKNVQMLKRFVNVEYLYDRKNLLDEKDSPVDKGEQVFKELYIYDRIKFR